MVARCALRELPPPPLFFELLVPVSQTELWLVSRRRYANVSQYGTLVPVKQYGVMPMLVNSYLPLRAMLFSWLLPAND